MWIFILLADTNEIKKFERIIMIYGDMMYRISFGILKNKTDSEDAVQQVLLGVLRQKDKPLFDNIESKDVSNYLKKAIKNESIKLLKSRFPIQKDEEEPYYDEDLTEKLATRDLYNKVIEVIKKMDKLYREPLYMRYVLGYSIKKIAKITNSKPDTVEKRIMRGKQIIRDKVSIKDYDF